MKSIGQSRTIIYQVISSMIAIIVAGISAMDNILPAQTIVIILLVLKVLDAGINTYLRLVTSEPLASPLNRS